MSGKLVLEDNHAMVLRLGRVGSFAPGNYMCKCVGCGVTFEGDKRALHCLPCAVDGLRRAALKGAETSTTPKQDGSHE